MTTSNVLDFTAPTIIPVILCGGIGSRLWPLSQEHKPKQLLPVVNQTILLHDTLDRIQNCVPNGLQHTITVTTEQLKEETIEQLRVFHPNCLNHVLCEPESKNTAAAIAYAALYAKENFGNNALLWILPADHFVEDNEALKEILTLLYQDFPQDKVLTFGVKPTYPATEYGYIKHNEFKSIITSVKSFMEKPDLEIAKQYYEADDYLWNSGMFMAHASTLLNEYIEYAPNTLQEISNGIQESALKQAYSNIDSISFDYAIMEKSSNVAVIKTDIGWSDVGSWQHIWQIKEKDSNGNVLDGQIIANHSENCLIKTENLTIATCGVKDLAIIEDGHLLLVADKKNKTNISTIKPFLKQEILNKKNSKKEKFCTKNSDYFVKEITLQKDESIPLHYHNKRSEQWVVLSGTAHITLEDKELDYQVGSSVHIPLTIQHAVRNLSDTPLKILEIQYGENVSAFDITYIEKTNMGIQEQT